MHMVNLSQSAATLASVLSIEHFQASIKHNGSAQICRVIIIVLHHLLIVYKRGKWVVPTLFPHVCYFAAHRYTVKELLQHDFFVEESGFKVELVTTEDEEQKPNIIFLRVRVVDPKKRKVQHKENEAIQFGYNLEKDDPEYVAKEMVRLMMDNYITERSVLWYYGFSIAAAASATRRRWRREHF